MAFPTPWSRLRQAQKLIRLGDKYGWSRINSACQRALAFDVINVDRVETILKQDLGQLDVFSAQETGAQVVPIESRFLRRAESFSHKPRTDGGNR